MEFSFINHSKENLIYLLRKLGYRFQREDTNRAELVFSRPLSQNAYPRFHLYLKKKEKQNHLHFKLHLDQKRPLYKGVPAHSGEYESELVTAEAKRIQDFFSQTSR